MWIFWVLIVQLYINSVDLMILYINSVDLLIFKKTISNAIYILYGNLNGTIQDMD